jgi:hypothetical protein
MASLLVFFSSYSPFEAAAFAAARLIKHACAFDSFSRCPCHARKATHIKTNHFYQAEVEQQYVT